jgi:hypothetical protein
LQRLNHACYEQLSNPCENLEMKTGVSRLRGGGRILPVLVATFGLALLGNAADDLLVLSDEFDDAGTLSQWQRVYQAEGWGFDQLEHWDINTTGSGQMFMRPHSSSWYEE